MAARGRRYCVIGQSTVASPTDSCVGITGATTVRPAIYQMIIGASATPADNALLWKIQRHTAAGTATAFTPVALDPADPASLTSAGYAHSAEPTYTANAFLFWAAINQRATHHWFADPDGYLQAPASANNGMTLYPIHASFASTVDATLFFAE